MTTEAHTCPLSFLKGVTPFSEFLKYKKRSNSFFWNFWWCSLKHKSSYLCWINSKKVLPAFHFDALVYSCSPLVSFYISKSTYISYKILKLLRSLWNMMCNGLYSYFWLSMLAGMEAMWYICLKTADARTYQEWWKGISKQENGNPAKARNNQIQKHLLAPPVMGGQNKHHRGGNK